MTDKSLKATEPSVENSEAVIAELATLPPLNYELQREKRAKALGIRVSMLDTLVEAKRPTPDDDPNNPFEEVVACSTTVDGSELVAEIITTIKRFCILPEHSATIMAFWILHAYAHDAADISPTLPVPWDSTIFGLCWSVTDRYCIVKPTQSAALQGGMARPANRSCGP